MFLRVALSSGQNWNWVERLRQSKFSFCLRFFPQNKIQAKLKIKLSRIFNKLHSTTACVALTIKQLHW